MRFNNLKLRNIIDFVVHIENALNQLKIEKEKHLFCIEMKEKMYASNSLSISIKYQIKKKLLNERR